MSTAVASSKVPEASSEESRRTSGHSAAPPGQQPSADSKPKRKRWILILSIAGAVIAVVALALTLGLYFGLKRTGGGGGNDHESGDAKNKTTHSNGDNVVDLGYSEYQGRELGNGITVFLGMRYAKAPIGDLRWRAPVAPEPTKGIQSAADVGISNPN